MVPMTTADLAKKLRERIEERKVAIEKTIDECDAIRKADKSRNVEMLQETLRKGYSVTELELVLKWIAELEAESP